MEVYQYLLPVQEFLYDVRNTVDVLVGIGLATSILGLARMKDKERKRRDRKVIGGRMTRKERIKYLHSAAGKAFSDWLVNQELNGALMASDVRYLSRRASYAFDMKDVLADRISFSGLTEEERELLASIMRSKAELRKMVEGRFKPKIPGAKPGEVDNVHIYPKEKKKFGDQLRKPKVA